MPKNIFHNNRSINHNIKTESLSNISSIEDIHMEQDIQIEQSVDINKLLNRVRIKEQNEKKQVFFFTGISILSLSILGLFLTIN